jgi:hypothetical protein
MGNILVATLLLEVELRDGGRVGALEGDAVNGREERELLHRVVLLEDAVHLLGRVRALQHLAIQQRLLELLPRRLLRDEGLGALAVAAAEARGDEVGDAAALEERVLLDAVEVLEAELLHLGQADADDGGLGVAAVLEAVAEAGAQRHHVLEGTAHLHAVRVQRHVHAERGGVEQLAQQRAMAEVSAAQRGLAEVSGGDLVGHVGAHQDAAVDVQALTDEVGHQHDSVLVEVNALDEGHGHGAFLEALLLDGDQHAAQELVRHAEDEDVGAAHGVLEVRHGDDVLRQLVAGQVLDVLVLGVDDLRELLAVHLLLEDPHVDVALERLGQVLGVLADDAGDGRAPVAGAHETDLLRHGGVLGRWRGRRNALKGANSGVTTMRPSSSAAALTSVGRDRKSSVGIRDRREPLYAATVDETFLC